jgi:hypothetical protein
LDEFRDQLNEFRQSFAEIVSNFKADNIEGEETVGAKSPIAKNSLTRID